MNKEEVINKINNELSAVDFKPENLQPAIERLCTLIWNAAIDAAVENVNMVYHDGHTKENIPTSHHQFGADNIQVNKSSITSLKFKTDEK